MAEPPSQPDPPDADDKYNARQVVADDLVCRDCKHALAELTLGDNCPNCDLPVVWSVRDANLGYADQAGQRRNASRQLQRNHPCRTCGYNLRGLSRDHVCPECGTEVRWSITGYLLNHADAGWLKTLLRGSSLLMFSVYTLMVIGALLIIIAALQDSSTGTLASRFGLLSLIALWLLVVWGLYVAGVWFLTTMEPRETPDDSNSSVRLVARWLSVISFPAMAIVTLIGTSDSDVIPAWGYLVAASASVASHLIFIQHLITLARRMRSKMHGRYMRSYQIGIALVALAAAWLLVVSPIRFSDEACCCGGPILFALIFLFGIWFLSVAADVNETIKVALQIRKDEGP